MREVYKAPAPESAVPDIVAYLTSMPTQKAVPATGKAQDPDPRAAPGASKHGPSEDRPFGRSRQYLAPAPRSSVVRA